MSFNSPYCNSGRPFFNPLSSRLIKNPYYQFSISRLNKRGSIAFVGAPMHWHDFVQIWYVTSGHYMHRIFGDTWNMGAGSLVVVPPFYAHQPYCVDAEIIDTICCDLSPEFLSELFGDRDQSLWLLKPVFFSADNIPILQLNPHEVSEFESLLFSIYNEYCSNPRKCIVMHKDKILQMFLFLMSRQVQCVKHERDKCILKHYDTIRQVIEYIDIHYNERLYIDNICKRAYMSQSHFSYVFKEITGNTLFEYVAIIRILKAAAALTLTDKPIIEIALMSGFNNKTHFYQQFQFYMGHTPRAHRIMTQDFRIEYNKSKTIR